ncbi:phage tail protein [Pseudomonas sp. P2757]|uniref:phage tail protein n=1 Tax=unclassified Pseudomonas TaxID=196821 RepID=UPI003B5BF7CB
MLASRSTQGFYNPDIHPQIPDDAVAISAELHAHLLAGQASGQMIAWGEDGKPALIDAPPLPLAELETVERIWRNSRLAATDGVVTRHRDELEEGMPTTLTQAQYIEVQAYRRLLRGWPEAGEFPFSEQRPLMPQWLFILIQ